MVHVTSKEDYTSINRIATAERASLEEVDLLTGTSLCLQQEPCSAIFISDERTTMKFETSENTVFVRFFFTRCCLTPGFHIVVSVVSVVRKKFIGQIEFILSCTTSCSCHFFCIEHLYGRFP